MDRSLWRSPREFDGLPRVSGMDLKQHAEAEGTSGLCVSGMDLPQRVD